MNALEWRDDWADALDQWQAVLRQTDWHPLPLAAAYALAALLCLRAAATARRAGLGGLGWAAGGALLACLAADTLLRLDLLAVYMMRDLALEADWYADRRAVQVEVLAAVAAALGLAVALHPPRRVVLGVGAVTGFLMLALVGAMRWVSLHQTDIVLALRLADAPLGRVVEWAGLALVLRGAMHWLRSR